MSAENPRSRPRIDGGGTLPARYEVLPFPRALKEAGEVGRPLHLTVTCSPKHGPDGGLDTAERLVELGHEVTIHVAARMVRDEAHADALLKRIRQLELTDLFLIGGDFPGDPGAFRSALELLELVAKHPLRPERIGIGGYPEGHPLIDDATLDGALLAKAKLADYVATQMCFDADALTRWLRRQRDSGMALPVWVGMPGQVSTAKLVEISARIGVGPSISFLRKQHGLRALVSLLMVRKQTVTERLLGDVVALSAEDPLVAGVHYFTFNQLIDTYQWHLAHGVTQQRSGSVPAPHPARGGVVS